MKNFWAMLGMSCIACGAAAQDSVVVEEPLIVTARPARTANAATVAPHVIYEAEELARFGAQTVGELIRRLPGVAFTSEAGEYDAPQLRGIGPEYTQLLIDGRRVPGLADDRSALVDRIPAALVERVEILRSPTADIDAQGIGGSLNVILRSGAAADGLRLSLGSMVDDQGTARVPAHAGVGASHGPLSGYLGVTLQPEHELRSKDTRTRGADGALIAQRRGEEVRDSRSSAADARATYRFDGGGALEFDSQYLRLKRDTRQRENIIELSEDPPAAFLADEREDEEQTTRGIGLRATVPMFAGFACTAGADLTRLAASRSASVQNIEDGASERIEDQRLRVRDREARADARCTLAHIAGHRLRFGAAGGQQERSARDQRTEFADGAPLDTSPFGGAYRVEERRTDGFVQALWAITPGWELDTGLRLETTRRDQSATSADTRARLSDDQQWLPNLHLRWSPGDDARLRASVARTLRRPGFDQLAPFRQRMDAVFFIGNPGLNPERAWGADLGYEQQVPVADLRFDANLFYRRIDDLIQNEAVAQDTRRPTNFGRGRVWGLELESGIGLDALGLRGAQFGGTLTLLDSTVRNPATGTSERFQRQPPYVFSLAFDQQIPSSRYAWGVAMNRQGASREVLAGSIEELRFGTGLDAYVSITLLPGVALRIAGRDLLDARAVDTTSQYADTRPVGVPQVIEREREILGPSLLISLDAEFR